MAAPHKILELRQLLSERFPEAHAGRPEGGASLPTGLACLDEIGLPRGALTECVCPGPSLGASLLIHGLLEALPAKGHHLALIDGQDGLDPCALDRDACRRLLWLRCRTAQEAVKAADLILRDGNLSFVLLDLQRNPASQLHRLQSQVWYRLQSLVKSNDAGCLILTPARLVNSARLRLSLEHRFSLDSMETPRRELLKQLMPLVTRRRRQGRFAGETGVAPQSALG